MTLTPEPEIDEDARLAAFLDGELDEAERRAMAERLAADPALNARLDHLAAGGLGSTEAFDRLLAEAPVDRLLARLEAAEATPLPSARASRGRVRLALAAAAVALLVAGGVVGFGLSRLLPEATDEQAGVQENWRAVVAEYLTLYTRETLAAIPDDAALRDQELAGVGDKLALDLSSGRVALPDFALKRAQLFAFNGMPLAQLAYLGAEDGPLAFCIIANGKPDEPVTFEVRDGRNIAYWQHGGRGFMVIGSQPRATIEAFATMLEKGVS